MAQFVDPAHDVSQFYGVYKDALFLYERVVSPLNFEKGGSIPLLKEGFVIIAPHTEGSFLVELRNSDRHLMHSSHVDYRFVNGYVQLRRHCSLYSFVVISGYIQFVCALAIDNNDDGGLKVFWSRYGQSFIFNILPYSSSPRTSGRSRFPRVTRDVQGWLAGGGET